LAKSASVTAAEVMSTEVVELTDREPGALLEPVPVDVVVVVEMPGQVDRGQVADGDVVAVLRQGDLGAQVRQVDRAGVVVERPDVDRVLPRQPRVWRWSAGTRGWR